MIMVIVHYNCSLSTDHSRIATLLGDCYRLTFKILQYHRNAISLYYWLTHYQVSIDSLLAHYWLTGCGMMMDFDNKGFPYTLYILCILGHYPLTIRPYAHIRWVSGTLVSNILLLRRAMNCVVWRYSFPPYVDKVNKQACLDVEAVSTGNPRLIYKEEDGAKPEQDDITVNSPSNHPSPT